MVSEEPLVCAEYAAHYIPALQVRGERRYQRDDKLVDQIVLIVCLAQHFLSLAFPPPFC